MAPSTWATTEQTEYLQSRVEEYCTFKASRKYEVFWRSLDQEWFEKWPEWLALFPDRSLDASLTPDENKLLGTAISKRKDQLQTWYRWTTGKSKRNRSALSQSSSFDLLLEKKGSRRLSKTEIYYSEFSDRVHAHIEGTSKDYCDRGVRLNSARSCAKKLLACEDEATKTLIDGLYKNQKVMKDGSDAQETDPESIRRAIDNLPYVLDAFAKVVKKRTGYMTSFVCAGPDPTRNWAITSLSYHPDEIEDVGLFSSQYPVEEHKYLQAYQDFAEVLLPEDIRRPKVKGDDEKHGKDSESLDGGNKDDHEDEQPAHPGDGPDAKSIEKSGGASNAMGHDGLYTFPLNSAPPSHASDASTPAPSTPVYQTDASVSGSSVFTAEPLTLDSAILPPADASLQPAGHFSSDFPLSDTSMDLDIFGDITGAGSAAYGIPESFTGGPDGISFSQAMDDAIQEFNALNQLSSNSDSAPVSVPPDYGLKWTFPDSIVPEVLVTNAPCSVVHSACAQTNNTAVSSATIPLAITPTHRDPDTGTTLPTPSDISTQSLKQKKRKTTARKKNLPVPGESNPVSVTINTGENTPALQSSPPPADTAVKRVRKKSTRNELANAIGTNMPTFVGKENIPPEGRESFAGQKRKQMETNNSPNKRSKKL